MSTAALSIWKWTGLSTTSSITWLTLTGQPSMANGMMANVSASSQRLLLRCWKSLTGFQTLFTVMTGILLWCPCS